MKCTLKRAGCRSGVEHFPGYTQDPGDAEVPEDCMSHFLELLAGSKELNRHKGVGATPSGRAILTGQ